MCTICKLQLPTTHTWEETSNVATDDMYNVYK